MTTTVVDRFNCYLPLGKNEIAVMASLESEERSFQRRAIIHQQNESSESLYIVKSGWVASYSQLHDGSRFIQSIYQPGDIVNVMGVGYTHMPAGLLSITESRLAPFSKRDLSRILAEYPRLSALMYALGMQECVVLADRLKAIAKMPGRDRVALLLLQIHARLRSANPAIGNEFDFYLSQEMVGDAVGITTVYANLVMGKLREEGLINIEKRRVSLLDERGLKACCDFNDRYQTLDTSWFPAN